MRTWILELSLIGGVLVGTAWSEAAETSRGRIVEVRPDAGSFLVAVATSGSEPIETVFFVDDLTRIRESGGVVSFSAVPSGGNVVVTYDRLEGRNPHTHLPGLGRVGRSARSDSRRCGRAVVPARRPAAIRFCAGRQGDGLCLQSR